MVIDEDLNVVKDTYGLDEGQDGCIGKCDPVHEGRKHEQLRQKESLY